MTTKVTVEGWLAFNAKTAVSDADLAMIIEENTGISGQAEAGAMDVLSMALELSARRATADVTEAMQQTLERIAAIKYPSVDTKYALKTTIDYARDQALATLNPPMGR